MEIRYASAFKRAYRKLQQQDQVLVDRALSLFASDPFSPKLRNHKLMGSKQGIRSISAAYDLRVLYVEEQNHTLVLLLTVGTHDAVY